jgi:hypothetical protein
MMSSLQGENLFYPNPGSTCQKKLCVISAYVWRLAMLRGVMHVLGEDGQIGNILGIWSLTRGGKMMK